MKPYYEHAGITIYHGDCREVLPAIAPNSVDLVLTDPPYGHNNNNGDLAHRWEAALGLVDRVDDEAARPIANDGPEANELVRWMFGEANRVLMPGCCCCCCCCGGGPDPQFARWSLWMDDVFRFKQMVVWDKGPMGMGWHYRRSYETVLVGERPGAACQWYGGNNKENIIRPGQYGINKIIPQKDQHPCAKPVELYQHFILLHTPNDAVVLDPFSGESPAGIACIRNGRRFVGIEISEEYCRNAVARMEAELSQPMLPFEETFPQESQSMMFDSP